MNSVFLFFCASILGYIWEILLTFFREGAWCNRGFLYGPWLPVYGAGALLFSLCLQSFRKNPLAVFFPAAAIGAVVELVTGLAFDRIWHTHYWDYSDALFNVMGYVCLLSVLAFGIAGTVWVCVLAPCLLKLWGHVSAGKQKLLTASFSLLFIADYLFSLVFPNGGSGITF